MRTNLKFTEYFFVGSGNQALRVAGDYQNAGNLVDITDGQLGIIAAGKTHLTYGTYLNTTNNPAGSGANTAANVPSIKVISGTPAAANNAAAYGWPSQDKGFLLSPFINANEVMSVSTSLPPIPTNSSVIVHAIPTVVASKVYSLFPRLRSVKKDRDYGDNLDTFPASYTSPATLPADPTDLVLQNLASQINRSSKLSPISFPRGTKEVVAFVIDTAGTGSGTTIGTLAIGSTVTVQTNTGGNMVITVDAAFLQTMNRWIADTATAITATSKIVNINLTTAGDATHDGTMLVVMGLDHASAAVYDGIHAKKVRVELTLGGEWYTGATKPTVTEAVPAVEDFNMGSSLIARFNERAFGQSGLTQLAGHSDSLLTTPHYIVAGQRYTVTVIDYQTIDRMLENESEHQTRLWILLPASFTGANVTAGLTAATTATTTVTNLNAIFGAWLASNTGVKYLGAATAAAPFV